MMKVKVDYLYQDKIKEWLKEVETVKQKCKTDTTIQNPYSVSLLLICLCLVCYTSIPFLLRIPITTNFSIFPDVLNFTSVFEISTIMYVLFVTISFYIIYKRKKTNAQIVREVDTTTNPSEIVDILFKYRKKNKDIEKLCKDYELYSAIETLRNAEVYDFTEVGFDELSVRYYTEDGTLRTLWLPENFKYNIDMNVKKDTSICINKDCSANIIQHVGKPKCLV